MPHSKVLCSFCSSITFLDLVQGFYHKLSYAEMLHSAISCPLCLMFVFSFSKLQRVPSDVILDDYEAWIPTLVTSPYIRRNPGLIETLEEPPDHLSWRPHSDATAERIDRGSINDGYAIQVFAPYESTYSRLDLVPVSDVQFAGGLRDSNLLRGWMGECEYHHAQCRLAFDGSSVAVADITHLPTRVIHVTSKPNPEGSYCILAKLLVTNGMKGRYLTLSHRWTKHAQFQAVRGNMDDLQRSIPNDISLTVLHAVQMTAILGFEYLWVDTLCIIQDDPEDREREISKMGDIFENAACMLAAVDTVHPDGSDSGLFHRSVPGPAPVHINMPCGPSDVDINQYESSMMDETSGTETASPWAAMIGLKIANPRGWYIIRNSEWHTRGWVMQERMLARRTIYFTKYKTVWDCRQGTYEEDRPPRTEWSPHRNLSAQFHLPPDGRPNLDQQAGAWEDWNWIVQEYSRCLLTYEQDKELAMAALCQRFEKRTSFTIRHGVPVSTAGKATSRGLLWITRRAVERHRQFFAPTWSWLSVNGPVAYELPSGILKLPPTRDDLTDDLTVDDSYLRLKVILRPATLGLKVTHLGLETYDDYLPITGSVIYGEGFQVRRGEGPSAMHKQVPAPRLPPHTRVLKTSHQGAIIGWAVLELELRNNTDVLCAAIQKRGLIFEENVPTADPEAMARRRTNRNALCEEHIDILLLERVATGMYDTQPRFYQRVGCGVVVAQGWLEQLKYEKVIIA